jgi:hypothetical protein
LFAPKDVVVAVSTGAAGATNGVAAVHLFDCRKRGADADHAGSRNAGRGSVLARVNAEQPVRLYVEQRIRHNLSGFALAASGVLSAIPGTVVATNPTGSTNLDLAVSADGRFLYSLNVGTGVMGSSRFRRMAPL